METAARVDAKKVEVKKVELGKKVPPFVLAATGAQTIALRDLKGKTVVLYFYPKDNTSGCTLEGQDFAKHHAAFAKAGAVVLGASRDSVKSHENFKAKYSFPFALLADEDETLCLTFDVIQLKNMYGKKVRGVVRSTFVINGDGVLVKEWRNVKVAGHAEEVLAYVKDPNASVEATSSVPKPRTKKATAKGAKSVTALKPAASRKVASAKK